MGLILLVFSALLIFLGSDPAFVQLSFVVGLALLLVSLTTRINYNIALARREQRKVTLARTRRVEELLIQIQTELSSNASRLDSLEDKLVKSIGVTNRNITSLRQEVGLQLSKDDIEGITTSSFQIALSQRRLEQALISTTLVDKEG